MMCRLTADEPVARRLRLDQDGNDPAGVRIGELVAGLHPQAAEHGADRGDVDGISHDIVGDDGVAGPASAVAQDDHLVAHQLDAGRGAGALGPETHVATDDASDSISGAISPRASATPRAEAPRESAMDR